MKAETLGAVIAAIVIVVVVLTLRSFYSNLGLEHIARSDNSIYLLELACRSCYHCCLARW